MDQQASTHLRARLERYWERTVPFLARVPAKAWIVLGLFLVAALLMAVHTAISSPDASLHLKVQHGFRSAQCSVWVDGDLAYSTRVTGSVKKKFGLIPDSIQGSLSQAVPISSGVHTIRVRLEPNDGSALEDTISGEFNSHTERELLVSARRSGVSLSWQNSSSTGSAASVTPGWFSRYAGSLFLTIAGSIVSALAGYALRELPAQLRARQNPDVKA
jgi:hypothetical protein